MKPWDPGLRVAVGISGAGKTHGIKDEGFRASQRIPIIVIDRVREWTRVVEGATVIPGAPKAAAPFIGVTSSVHEAATQIADGKRLVIVQSDDDEIATFAACKWACEHDGVAGIIVPEAHRIAPNAGTTLPDRYLENVASAWRHYNVAAWFDSQRIARLHTAIVENARELRIYAQSGHRDLATVADIDLSDSGKELAPLVREAAVRLRKGEPGWHVRLDLDRAPPYELRRI